MRRGESILDHGAGDRPPRPGNRDLGPRGAALPSGGVAPPPDRALRGSVGAEPSDIRTLADLAHLPVVTKEELREDQRRHPPFGTFAVADPGEFREVHPSTGTTG